MYIANLHPPGSEMYVVSVVVYPITPIVSPPISNFADL